MLQNYWDHLTPRSSCSWTRWSRQCRSCPRPPPWRCSPAPPRSGPCLSRAGSPSGPPCWCILACVCHKSYTKENNFIYFILLFRQNPVQVWWQRCTNLAEAELNLLCRHRHHKTTWTPADCSMTHPVISSVKTINHQDFLSISDEVNNDGDDVLYMRLVSRITYFTKLRELWVSFKLNKHKKILH